MSTDKRDRILTREVTATQIPSGDKQTLFKGDSVFIHQVLGGSYTVQTSTGLFRLDGKDADAIGETVAEQTVTASTLADGAPDPAAVWDQLRKVFDPEIPVNIVDLGLVYDCRVENLDGKNKATIKMTLTAPGCGMGPTIAADAQARVMTIEDIEKAVSTLPPDQFAKFRDWFEAFDATRFDDKIERDAKAGRLDRLAEQALADFRQGRVRDI